MASFLRFSCPFLVTAFLAATGCSASSDEASEASEDAITRAQWSTSVKAYYASKGFDLRSDASAYAYTFEPTLPGASGDRYEALKTDFGDAVTLFGVTIAGLYAMAIETRVEGAAYAEIFDRTGRLVARGSVSEGEAFHWDDITIDEPVPSFQPTVAGTYRCKPYPDQSPIEAPVLLTIDAEAKGVDLVSEGKTYVAIFDPAYRPRTYRNFALYVGFAGLPEAQGVIVHKNLLLGKTSGSVRLRLAGPGMTDGFMYQPLSCRRQ